MRLGLVGTGRIATRAVRELQAIAEDRDRWDVDIELTTIVNPNADHAKEFIENNRLNAIASDKLLTDEVDTIYIASPHGTHYEYTKKALLAGLHVLCEKPFVLSRAQAEELYDIAEDKGLVLMEAVKTAYCPGFKKIEEIVAEGKIGDVVDVDATFTRLIPPGGREYTDLKYGGAFTEFGTYPMLPVMRFLGTDYRSISFMSRGEDVDGYTRCIFDYGGRFGSCRTGLTVKSEGQMVISGTKGYILVPSPWWLTKYIEVRYEDPSHVEKYECEYEGDGLRYEFVEFAERVYRGDRSRNRILAANDGIEHTDETGGESESLTDCDYSLEKCESVSRAAVFEEFLRLRD